MPRSLQKPTISKQNFVRRVSRLSDVPMKPTKQVMDAMFQVIKDLIEEGEVIHIAGFGKFYHTMVKGHTVINPYDKKPVTYNDRWICRFRPSEVFTHQLNAGAGEDVESDEKFEEEKEGSLEIYD